MQQYRALRTVHANTRDKNDAAMDGRMSYRPIQVACITNAHGGGERRAQVRAAGETRPRQGRRRRVDWTEGIPGIYADPLSFLGSEVGQV